MSLSITAIAFIVLAIHIAVVNSNGNDLRLRDIESDAKEWLEELKQFTDTVEAEADWFKKVDEKLESPALEHSVKLVGCLATLIGGFLGDSKSSYVKEIAAIQKALDLAISLIQEELQELIESIQEDFLKIFLAPKVERLRSAVSFLTEFSQADAKKGPARKTFEDQMSPISDSVDAWNGVAECFLGQVSSCPSNMLDIILHDAQAWPRPAVLIQFSAFHYNILSSSATAICAYQNITGVPCALDLAKLHSVAQKIQDQHASMENDVRGALVGGNMPAMMKTIVNHHASGGFDGAKAARDQIELELQNFYFTDGLDNFWGARQSAVIIFKQEVNAAWQSTGWMKHYQGYDIVVAFSNSSDAGVAVSNSDCYSGNAETQRDCLTGTKGALNALAYDDTGGTEFWAGTFRGSYYRDALQGSGGCCKLHVVTPGYPASRAAKNASGSWSSPVRAQSSKSNVGQGIVALQAPQRKDVVLSDDSSPSDVLDDIGNILSTAGAIADFFGPEGEVVGLALSFFGSIFNLIGGLLGIGQPDPVIQALRNMEKDLMGRLTAVSDTIAQARSTLDKAAANNVLNNAEIPLKDLLAAWNTLYPKGANPAAVKAFGQSASPISKHIIAWSLLRDCLTGANIDCVFDDHGVLDVLLTDGQDWMRPLILTQTVKYYYILLQKSAVAICGYGRVVDGDDRKNCPLLPNLKDDLQAISKSMQKSVTSMKSAWDSQMGDQKVLSLIQVTTDQYANKGYDGSKAIRDAVQTELDAYYFADGLDHFFGAQQSAIIIFKQEVNAAWQSTGWMKHYQGYDIVYAFSNSSDAGVAVSNSDCYSGNAEAQRNCLTGTKGALNALAYDDTGGTEFWAGTFRGSYYRDALEGSGHCCKLHVVTPGYAASGGANNAIAGWPSSVRAQSSMSDVKHGMVVPQAPQRIDVVLGDDPSPSDGFDDVGNILSIAGAIGLPKSNVTKRHISAGSGALHRGDDQHPAAVGSDHRPALITLVI